MSIRDELEYQLKQAKEKQKRKVENGLLMDVMDVLYGANRTTNGMTLGVMDLLGEKLGIDTQMTDYLRQKDVKSRNIAEAAGTIAEIGGAVLIGNTSNEAIQRGYNEITRWNGKRNLTNQLQRGNRFEDINMGKIDKDKLYDLNNIRHREQVEPILSRRVIIPQDRVQHIYEERIIKNGYKPQDATNSISDALFNKNTQVYPTRYSTLQKFESSTPNRAIVGKMRNENNIFVKTGYKK